MSKGKEKVNVPGLPKPWLAYASSRYEGRVFYYNPETRESRWDVPENRTPSLAVRLSTKNASSEVCFNKKTIEGRRSIQIPKKRGTSKKKRSNREDAPSSTVVHPSDVKSPVIRRHQQYVHQMSQSFDKKILMKMKEKSNFSLSEDSANLSLSTGKSFSHNQTTTGAVFVPHDSVKHLPQKCPNKPSAFENVSSKASNARGSDKKISQKLAVGSCHASTSSIKQTIKEPGNDVCFDMGTKRQSVKTKVFQRKNSVSNSRAILDEEELEDYNKAVSRLPPSVTNDSSIKNEAACVKNVCSDKGKFANKTASALERNTKNVFHQMTITQNFSEVKNFVANKPTMNVIRDTESRASEKNVSVDTELPVKSCAKKSHLEKFAQYQNQSGGKIIHNDLSASNIAQNLSMISETHSRGDTDSSTNDDNNGDAMDVDIVVPSKKIRIDDVEPMDIDYVEEITKYRNAVFLHPDEHYCETVGLKSVSDTQKQITQSSNDEVLLDAFVAVFDTSALLEDPLLLKRCVEYSIFIVIPFTVVNEIDGLKKSSETSDVAKAAVAVNNSLFDLSRMRNEFLILESSMEAREGFEEFGCSKNDDIILKCAVKSVMNFSDQLEVIFVTNDKNLSVKAAAYSVTTFSSKELNHILQKRTLVNKKVCEEKCSSEESEPSFKINPKVLVYRHCCDREKDNVLGTDNHLTSSPHSTFILPADSENKVETSAALEPVSYASPLKIFEYEQLISPLANTSTCFPEAAIFKSSTACTVEDTKMGDLNEHVLLKQEAPTDALEMQPDGFPISEVHISHSAVPNFSFRDVLCSSSSPGSATADCLSTSGSSKSPFLSVSSNSRWQSVANEEGTSIKHQKSLSDTQSSSQYQSFIENSDSCQHRGWRKRKTILDGRDVECLLEGCRQVVEMIIKNRGRSQFSKKAEIDAERIFTAVERISSGSPEYVHFSAFVDIISVLRMFYLQPNSFRSKVRFEKNFLFSQFERNRQQYQLQLSAILTMMRKKFSVCT